MHPSCMHGACMVHVRAVHRAAGTFMSTDHNYCCSAWPNDLFNYLRIQFAPRERNHAQNCTLNSGFYGARSQCSEITALCPSINPLNSTKTRLSERIISSAAFPFEIFTYEYGPFRNFDFIYGKGAISLWHCDLNWGL